MAVINPWIFYIIEIASNVSVILYCIFVIMLIFAVVYGIFTLNMLADKDLFEDELEKAKKNLKRLFMALALVTALVAFIPSKETMYTMLIADNVTYENLDKVAEVIQDSVDYVFDKMEGDD